MTPPKVIALLAVRFHRLILLHGAASAIAALLMSGCAAGPGSADPLARSSVPRFHPVPTHNIFYPDSWAIPSGPSSYHPQLIPISDPIPQPELNPPDADPENPPIPQSTKPAASVGEFRIETFLHDAPVRETKSIPDVKPGRKI